MRTHIPLRLTNWLELFMSDMSDSVYTLWCIVNTIKTSQFSSTHGTALTSYTDWHLDFLWTACRRRLFCSRSDDWPLLSLERYRYFCSVWVCVCECDSGSCTVLLGVIKHTHLWTLSFCAGTTQSVYEHILNTPQTCWHFRLIIFAIL